MNDTLQEDKFIGSRKISGIESVGQETQISFEDGTTILYTPKALAYLITDEAITDSELQEKTIEAVAQNILDVLAEHDVRFSDLGMIMQRVQWSAGAYQDRAMSKVAGLLDKFDGNVDIQIRNIRISHLKNFLNS